MGTTMIKAPAWKTAPSTAHGAVFARMGKNVAWLLGGRGFVGITSLAYLAIAARSLGPLGFGAFSLILAYGQIISALMQFQSWQGVIRYGALHLARENEPALARMLGFTAMLDIGSALLGALLAVAAVGMVGGFLDWSPVEQGHAAWFGVALLLSIGATPQGILRLFDRFDLITYCQAIAPTIRLAGSIAAWASDAGMGAFLVVWALAQISQNLALWIIAIGPAGRRPSLGITPFRQAPLENPGIWRFMLTTNFSSSLGLFGEQLGTLVVGGAAGTAAAGGFRLASRLARSIAKPIQTMARVIYPELARLVANDDRTTMRHVVIRSSLVAASLAGLIVLVAIFGGNLLIDLIAGRDYRFAHGFLVLLALASAIDLAGFAMEPLLNAHGRAGAVLAARLAGASIYSLLLALLLPMIGPIAVAVAAVGMAMIVKLPLVGAARRTLNRGAASSMRPPARSGTPPAG